MADEVLVSRVRELGDVDLAALLCLISREHCIISTEPDYLDDLTVELQLVASRTFGLNSVVVDCSPETTLDDFTTAIQLPPPSQSPSPLHARNSESYFSPHPGGRRHQHGSTRPSSRSPSVTATSPLKASFPSIGTTQQTQIANVILARNLDTVPKAVQIHCLELMRTRRIFIRPAMQACPKQFLLIAVLGAESAGEARLTKHLNDHFYISHWQDPEDGFAHIDEEEEEEEEEEKGDKEKVYPFTNDDGKGTTEDIDQDMNDDAASQASSESVVRRTTRGSRAPPTPIPTSTMSTSPDSGYQQHTATRDWAVPHRVIPHSTDNQVPSSNSNNSTAAGGGPPPQRSPVFTETEISTLSTLSLQTHVDIEVQRYQMNIIAFLRMHRAVAPGSVPPAATTHFHVLIRSLATLHGLDFVTPELVQLAARKIYAHHVVIVPPERERSMQWGSDLSTVKALLESVQPEDVVEEVLSMVDAPL